MNFFLLILVLFYVTIQSKQSIMKKERGTESRIEQRAALNFAVEISQFSN